MGGEEEQRVIIPEGTELGGALFATGDIAGRVVGELADQEAIIVETNMRVNGLFVTEQYQVVKRAVRYPTQ